MPEFPGQIRLQYLISGEAAQVPERAMLHEAMDAYIAKIKKDYHNEHTGRITANGAMKIKQVQLLKTRHSDQPLAKVGLDEIESMLIYWRKRPLRKGTTRPIARKSAKHAIGELSRFFRWLHRTPKFKWRKPEDFDELETGVLYLPTDNTQGLDKVETFTLNELVLLNEYATPLERTFLLLALNCGFNRAEIASLSTRRFRGRQPCW